MRDILISFINKKYYIIVLLFIVKVANKLVLKILLLKMIVYFLTILVGTSNYIKIILLLDILFNYLDLL